MQTVRPEHPHPNATVVCKLGWTEWTTKGIGRGKAPRKKHQKRARPESEEESNSENSREFEGTPCPDGNSDIIEVLPTHIYGRRISSRG